MYRVIKVLNNNTILAKDGECEVILMHKGIGFSKKSDDTLEVPATAKQYRMEEAMMKKPEFSKVIDTIDPIYLEIASDILKVTSDSFENVDDGILLSLADHICFTIKRMEDNSVPSNPFIHDIRLLFPEEYEVACKAKAIIARAIHKDINEDELGFITLHIHSAVSSNEITESMEAARVIHESVANIQKELGVKVDTTSVSYVRLMNHIKFLIIRINKSEELETDISEFAKQKFSFAYEQSSKICAALSKTLNKNIPENEVGYLALHLERILINVPH